VGAEARPEEEKYGGATLAHERAVASGGKAVTAAARTLPAAGSELGGEGSRPEGSGKPIRCGRGSPESLTRGLLRPPRRVLRGTTAYGRLAKAVNRRWNGPPDCSAPQAVDSFMRLF
jgi:hypothetical protein